jgi:hypothetical protein
MRVLTFLVLTIFVQSCVTYQKCVDKFTTRLQPTTITLHDTVRIAVPLPPDSASADINLDTLCAYWQTEAARFSSQVSGRELELRHWVDQYNRVLRVKARLVRDTVYVEKIVTVEGECPPALVVDPDKAAPWHSRLWKKFQTFSAWALLAGLLLFAVYIRFKR